MPYVKPAVAVKELGVCPDTLRTWAKTGKIKYIRGEGRCRLYDISSVITNDTINQTESQTECYIYARVSSSKQKEDLERQVQYLKEKYPDYQVVKEIASGINFKRKGLQRIINRALQGHVRSVVLAHRDRLCRIAWDHFEWLFKQLGVSIINEDTSSHSPSGDLAEDLISIVHVFSCRHYGQRRSYTKTRTSKDKIKDVKLTGEQESEEIATSSEGGGY